MNTGFEFNMSAHMQAIPARTYISRNAPLEDKLNSISTWLKENTEYFGRPDESLLVNAAQERYQKFYKNQQMTSTGPKIRGQSRVCRTYLFCYDCFCKTPTQFTRNHNSQDIKTWRSGKFGKNTLCNGCGLLYKKVTKSRIAENTSRATSETSTSSNLTNVELTAKSITQLLREMDFGNSDQEVAIVKNSVERYCRYPENKIRDVRTDQKVGPVSKSTGICLDCKTEETTQWRRGPLGPGTLCNACGIKYYKKVKKKNHEGVGKESDSQQISLSSDRMDTDQTEAINRSRQTTTTSTSFHPRSTFQIPPFSLNTSIGTSEKMETDSDPETDPIKNINSPAKGVKSDLSYILCKDQENETTTNNPFFLTQTPQEGFIQSRSNQDNSNTQNKSRITYLLNQDEEPNDTTTTGSLINQTPSNNFISPWFHLENSNELQHLDLNANNTSCSSTDDPLYKSRINSILN